MIFTSALLRLYYSTMCCCVLLSVRGCHANFSSSYEARGTLGAFAAEKVIEKIQYRMRYGFPLLKIPPWSPLKLNNRKCAVNLSLLQLNSSLNNLLVEGIDRFTINRVKFNWRNKSMDFSLTFRDLSLRGVFEGVGSFVKYIPISGRGNFTYSIYNLTTNVFTSIAIENARMQIDNLTMISTVERVRSNISGLSSDNYLSTRIINRMLNRMIEYASYNIFRMNQRLINQAVNRIIVPRINHILTTFVVLAPSTKFGYGNEAEQTSIYLHELDDKTFIESSLKYHHLIPQHDDDQEILIYYKNKNDQYDTSNKRVHCE